MFRKADISAWIGFQKILLRDKIMERKKLSLPQEDLYLIVLYLPVSSIVGARSFIVTPIKLLLGWSNNVHSTCMCT